MDKLRQVLRFILPSVFPCLLAALCSLESTMYYAIHRAQIDIWVYNLWNVAFVLLTALGVLFIAMRLLSPQRTDVLSTALGIAVIVALFLFMHWDRFLMPFDTSGLLFTQLLIIYAVALVVGLRGRSIA